MTLKIATEDDGRIVWRYWGNKDDAGRTFETVHELEESQWPDDDEIDPDEDEVPRYYYDGEMGEIYVEYERIESADADK